MPDKDPIEELAHFVMNILPGISSWGTAYDSLIAVLNTYFAGEAGVALLVHHGVFLGTFGINTMEFQGELTISYGGDMLWVEYSKEKNLWTQVNLTGKLP